MMMAAIREPESAYARWGKLPARSGRRAAGGCRPSPPDPLFVAAMAQIAAFWGRALTARLRTDRAGPDCRPRSFCAWPHRVPKLAVDRVAAPRRSETTVGFLSAGVSEFGCGQSVPLRSNHRIADKFFKAVKVCAHRRPSTLPDEQRGDHRFRRFEPSSACLLGLEAARQEREPPLHVHASRERQSKL
jgi:hypothetical protein